MDRDRLTKLPPASEGVKEAHPALAAVALLVAGVFALVAGASYRLPVPVLRPAGDGYPRAPVEPVPTTRPDGAFRYLVLLGFGLEPPDPEVVGSLPGSVAARELILRGPDDRDLAIASLLTGFDPGTYLPIGPGPPVPPEFPTLSTVAVDHGGELVLMTSRAFDPAPEPPAPPGRSKGRRPPPRHLDRVDPLDRDPASGKDPVTERLAALTVAPWDGLASSLWWVALEAGGTMPRAWPEGLKEAARTFLAHGPPGRSAILALSLPRGAGTGARRRTPAVLIGPMARGLPPAELELEDVAPSLARALGWPEPAGSKGVPRLDLLVPKDPRGGFASLLGTLEGARARMTVLLPETIRGRVGAVSGAAAEKAYREGRFREALEILIEARRGLRDLATRVPRELREEGRRDRAGSAWMFMVLAGVSMLGAILGGGGRALGLGTLGVLLQVGVLVGIRGRWGPAPEVLYRTALEKPEAMTWVGCGLGLAGAIPAALGAGSRGGVAAAYLVAAGPWLLGLGSLLFLVGPGFPTFLTPSEPYLAALVVYQVSLWMPGWFVIAALPPRPAGR